MRTFLFWRKVLVYNLLFIGSSFNLIYGVECVKKAMEMQQGNTKVACSTHFINGPTWVAESELGPRSGDEHLWFMYIWLNWPVWL